MRKHAADSLTMTRLILALALIGFGLSDGRANLARDIWILVLAWTTDMVDGELARALNTEQRTWLGRQDVYVDMFVSAAGLVYLTGTGLLPPAIMLGYLLVWGLLFWRFGIQELLAQIFQNPIYAYFLIMTALAAPQVLPWLLLYGLVSFILFRRRLFELLQDVVQVIWKKPDDGA